MFQELEENTCLNYKLKPSPLREEEILTGADISLHRTILLSVDNWLLISTAQHCH